jgi:L-amino acid N-acyltransferase YncA
LGGSENVGVAEYINKLLPKQPRHPVQSVVFRAPLHSPEIQIRAVVPGDLGPLAHVYREMYNGLTTLDEHWTKATARTFIAHFYQRQPDLFFLAEAEGQVVGGAVAAIQPWWDGNHLVEGEVFVKPALVPAGIESKLLKALITRARSKYHVVAWDTITPAVDGHPLGSYQDLGFTEVPHWKAVSADAHALISRLED